ncbi:MULTISPECIES: hypothetical protein [Bacillus]|uniref:hypothetical protein n=1 Tax=Bacillus TaxID=1386 RepID=UPI00047095A9|nr:MULTISPECIES: hypothetical protein [Bacillus]KUL18274.1 hypothetical protein LI6934_08410 [Bacillus licheniformis LMG 6934]MBG9881860.1 hypothetical protein [Bacillus paralicheniformis]MDE1359405.1 hypothetical protein [Bacillus paralicheniformis]MDE1391613.1 hypothetical protein [Bacillus paralicheniformis]MDN5386899.1 hypothetical protein [Bacillus sp. LB7]
MTKKRFVSFSVIILLLVITGCGKGDVQEVIYKKGLPKEDSPAFGEFMRHELDLATDATLNYQDHIYTIMRSDKEGLRYYKYTDKELMDLYKPIFSAKKNPSKKLYDLAQINFLEKRKINNELDENLPEMMLDKKNVLKVKTTSGEKQFELPSANGKKVYLALQEINKENMLIQIRMYKKLKNGSLEGRQIYYLFLKRDFSKHEVVKEEELNASIESGKLKEYLSVFPKVTEDGSYHKLFDKYIFEKKANKVRKIKDTDILSKDGKYVYINGAKEKENFVISDGIQRIQTVDNYLKGNEKYEAQFKIDFKQIAKEMDFNAGDARIANVQYFNENYVVLFISYHGKMIGTAGSLNVLIDLQKNKKQPTAYLVDLGISR